MTGLAGRDVLGDTARVRVAAAGVLACVLLAGCGSGGDEAVPSASGPASTSSASVPETASTSAATFAVDGQLTLTGTEVYGVDSTTSDPKTCYGIFGFADIKVGTQVQVTVDEKTVAVGSLTESVEDAANNVCAFHVEVPDVPANLKFYKVTIGGHNSEILSQEDVANVKLNLS